MVRFNHPQGMPGFNAAIVGIEKLIDLSVPQKDRTEAEYIHSAFLQQLLRRILRAFIYLEPSVRILSHHIQVRQMMAGSAVCCFTDDPAFTDDDPDSLFTGHSRRVKIVGEPEHKPLVPGNVVRIAELFARMLRIRDRCAERFPVPGQDLGFKPFQRNRRLFSAPDEDLQVSVQVNPLSCFIVFGEILSVARQETFRIPFRPAGFHDRSRCHQRFQGRPRFPDRLVREQPFCCFCVNVPGLREAVQALKLPDRLCCLVVILFCNTSRLQITELLKTLLHFGHPVPL